MSPEPEHQSPVERRIERSFEDDQGVGKPLSRRARQTRRSVESYLKAGGPPRYMEGLRAIESETEEQRRRLERTHRLLREECAGDPELFAALWRRRATRWRFDKLHGLIDQHNEGDPIE